MLAYLWIKSYKNIENCSFNFDNKYIYEFAEFDKSKRNSKRNFKLEINEKENSQTGDFFSSNISNLSIILGENGAGKSNMIDFLKKIYSLNTITNQFILVFRNNNQVFTYFSKFDKEINFQYETHLDVSYSSGNFLKNKISEELLENISKSRLVFYSDVFDYRKEEEYTNGCLSNLSTNYKIAKLGINSYRTVVIKEQLEFLNSKYRKLSGIKKPEFIELKILSQTQKTIKTAFRDPFSNQNRKQYRSYRTNNITEILQEIGSDLTFNQIQEKLFDTLNKEEFYKVKAKGEKREYERLVNMNSAKEHNRRAFASILFHLVNSISEYLTDETIALLYDQMNKSVNFKSMSYRLQVNILNKLQSEEKEQTDFSFIQIITGILKEFHSILAENEVRKNKKRLILKVRETTRRIEATFFALKVCGHDKALHIDFNDLSSGEKAKLNLYSKLYALSKTKNLPDELVLIIDECGLYYHPEWQQYFIYDLIKYTQTIFSKKTLQLLIATHSPILLSDVPKGNIVFIERNVETGYSYKPNTEMPNTFAANINDLLAHSFTLEEGVIGKFAYEKIKSDLINISKIAPENRIEMLQQYQSIIGDEIMRYQIERALGDIND